jgi:excisionase family DNA binding protein
MMFLATSASSKSFTLSRSKPMPDLKDYMTTEEAAKVLDVHVVTIRKMVAKGKLQSLKAGIALLISRSSVDQYKKTTAGMDKNDPRRGRKKS